MSGAPSSSSGVGGGKQPKLQLKAATEKKTKARTPGEEKASGEASKKKKQAKTEAAARAAAAASSSASSPGLAPGRRADQLGSDEEDAAAEEEEETQHQQAAPDAEQEGPALTNSSIEAEAGVRLAELQREFALAKAELAAAKAEVALAAGLQATKVAQAAREAQDDTSEDEIEAARARYDRLIAASEARRRAKGMTPASDPEAREAAAEQAVREARAEALLQVQAAARRASAARMAALWSPGAQEAAAGGAELGAGAGPLGSQSRLQPSPGMPSPGMIPRQQAHVGFRRPKPLEGIQRLESESASKNGNLEKWIYEVEMRINGAVADGGDLQEFRWQLLFMQQSWDVYVNNWFVSAQREAEGRGRPINSAPAIFEALKANYTPFSDEKEARELLHKLRMRDGETMATYTARARELYGRCDHRRMPTVTAGDRLLSGLAVSRFPTTYNTVTKAAEEALRNGGRGLSFDEVVQKLTMEAVAEPAAVIQQQRQASESSGSGGFRAAPARARGGAGGNRSRVAVLSSSVRDDARDQHRYPDEGECEEGYDSDEHYQTNVMREATCFRCKSRDHFIADCKEKETRKCPICGVQGHVRFSCPKNQQPGGGSQASRGRGGRRGGGRASSGAGFSPSPKNE
jgi:chemotaxis protein histidine kinase CheA